MITVLAVSSVEVILGSSLLAAIVALIGTILQLRAAQQRTDAEADKTGAEADAVRVKTADELIQMVKAELDGAQALVAQLREDLSHTARERDKFRLDLESCQQRCAALTRQLADMQTSLRQPT